MPNELQAIAEEFARMLMEQFEQPQLIPGCLVKSVADKNEYTTNNGWIEAICGEHNQQRVRYRGQPAGLVVDTTYLDVLYFPNRKGFEVYGPGGSSESGVTKVDQVWESDFGAVALQADADGGVGIGTDTIPHGSTGIARLALDGANASTAGPHIQITTDNDDYPTVQLLSWSHDNIALNLDAYFDGANWKSGDAGSNFQLYKVSDALQLRYDSGVAQGSNITWVTGIYLDTAGNVGVGTSGPDAKLDILANSGVQLRITHTDGSVFADLSVDSNHDLTIQPSSTGQIKLKATSDSVDFLQVIDAGSTVTLNVDSSNNRVGINTSAPTTDLYVSTPSAVTTLLGLHNPNANGNEFLVFIQDGTQKGIFGYRDAEDRVIINYGTSSSPAHISVDSSGNVGIGTATPSTQLDVDAGAIEFAEMTAPGGGAANTARLYAVDNGAGKTQLVVVFNTGAAQVLATEP